LWIIATLAGLAALIIFALSMPLDLRLHIDTYGRPRFRIRLSWFFGLVNKEITKKEKKPEDKNKTAKLEQKPKEKRLGTRIILEILRTKGLLSQIKILIKDIGFNNKNKKNKKKKSKPQIEELIVSQKNIAS